MIAWILLAAWLIQLVVWFAERRKHLAAEELSGELLAQVNRMDAIVVERDAQLKTMEGTAAQTIAALESRLERTDQAAAETVKLIPQWNDEVTRLQAELEHERRRVKNLQKIIASVVDQRQFWAEWYHRQASEHGQAQNLLLCEVERLVFHVQHLGGNTKLHPALKELARQFSDQHPRLADAGEPSSPGQLPLEERKVEGAP